MPAPSAPSLSATGKKEKNIALAQTCFHNTHVFFFFLFRPKEMFMTHARSLRYWKRQRRNWPVNVTLILTSVCISITFLQHRASRLYDPLSTDPTYPGGSKWCVCRSLCFRSLYSSCSFWPVLDRKYRERNLPVRAKPLVHHQLGVC